MRKFYFFLKRIYCSLYCFVFGLNSKDYFVISGFKLINHKSFGKEILWSVNRNHYENHEVDLINEFMEPTDRVLELGGGMGLLSMVTSKIVPDENIFVFEANPLMYEINTNNYRVNNLNNINVYNNILGHGEKTRSFGITQSFECSNLLMTDAVDTISVEQLDLDNFIRENSINTIMIDIEGGEYELIYDGYVFPDIVKKLFVETHPSQNFNNIDLTVIIEKQGFKAIKSWGQSVYYEK